ncbi:MAG TPA: proton-conducting transporter membrane subunit, partial [Pirellulaceae bacterium]|nr:proton-conducting transporter membrane subunit [Pirellulaceae bacterium]
FVTPRSKRARFPFGLTLVSLSFLLAMFCTRDPVLIVGWMALQTVLPWVELRRRKQAASFFMGHQLLSIALILVGWFVGQGQTPESVLGIWGVSLIASGLLIRCGCVPVHCWMIDLFDRVSLGTALLMVAPMAGAYGLVRMVLPIAPDSILRGIALVSLVTAVYASGMVLVQTSTRRFYCYLFLSNSSLLLIGLESLTPVGLTGSLSLWLSIGVALTSFGIIIRAIEGRVGRLALDRFHGLYGQMPLLAGLFLLALLASIGFPGTIGFVGTELLIEGALDAYSYSGMLVVLAMAINGIGALRAYFKLFTGTTAPATISMQPRINELLTIWAFSLTMIAGGLYPQPGVMMRYRAVHELLRERAAHFEEMNLSLSHYWEIEE